ncbi:trypsin delta-like [Diachasmimorpha longicaudata]|uniref:trypsin delta-like n=1 Tax=Diachasmimorpha longicaudata TaxID=58733 RepID=UPI0030B8CF57
MGLVRIELIVVLVVCVSLGGYGNPTSKILGGSVVAPGELPCLAFLQTRDGQFLCGAAIISDSHLLTAAHCILNLRNGRNVIRHLIAVTGTVDRHSFNPADTFNITRFYYSRNYTTVLNGPDIMILKLNGSIVFDNFKQPIALPSTPTPSGEVATVSGWGHASLVDGKREIHQHLLKLGVKIIDLDECKSHFGDRVGLNNMCATSAIGSGFCMGDSGGPLIYNSTVIGIVSVALGDTGPECGSRHPDIYANVYLQTSWIKCVMKEEGSCLGIIVRH